LATVSAGAPAVTARGVSRRYGPRVALEPTDLDVRTGEVVVLLGPNGAGKSTLLALLAGALPPTAGEVATELPSAAVGWAPQRPAQYRRLSARENLALFARLLALDDPAAAAEAMLAEFGLPPDERPSAHLSVGNQQRLNLAIAFLGAPTLLLLDEPTASLDPPQARALWERISRARADGAGAVVATHVLDEALHADRVLSLQDGRVVFSGTPAELE
jgi:ABC-2 type transport system ATP-binding protein